MLKKKYYMSDVRHGIVLPVDGTDLACEVWDGGEGVIQSEEDVTTDNGTVRIDRMQIVTDGAAKRLGRRRGRYITFTFPQALSVFCGSYRDAVAKLIEKELLYLARELSDRPIGGDFGVLVVGLGNSDLTVDALGPATAALVTATAHLREQTGNIYKMLDCSAISVISPGVAGRTGIESADIIRGAVNAACPDLLIVIDSLAARSCKRLGCTIQLTDSGINPGSGVDDGRGTLTHKNIGIPIISIGVPTVVGSSTLIYEALLEAKMVTDDRTAIPPNLAAVLDNRKSFFVSPQDSDLITSVAADIISRAINLAFGVVE